MKKVFVLLIGMILFPSIAGAAPAHESGVSFKDIEGKEWILGEFKSGGRTVTLDRKKYEADNMANYYTITFRDGNVNGIGAPNRYFGPYTAGSNRSLALGNMASTLMMAFREPEEIKEYEYLKLLSGIKRWDLSGRNLELHCTAEDGTETLLVFGLIR